VKQPPVYFERIRESAVKRWEQLEGDPELAGPWHQLFKQVQSPRHVLSELLQNADDAGATQATVSLDDGQTVFSHNGEDFAEDHFASLCRFGYALMLENTSGQPAVLSGTHLHELRDDGKITLYPATYRLVFDNDNQ